MKYAKILKYDTGNWAGVNSTIFFSGCKFKCPGCFNKCAQDFNYGAEYTQEVEDLFISYLQDSHVVGACILGGEPFQQDLDILLRLVKRITYETHKAIHIWSGFTYEELTSDPKKIQILCYVDTLVDGRFILEKKDLNLKYRGSSNQRVIDVQGSLLANRVVEMDI